jgi:predicted HTH transcriptional regulator
MLSSKEIEELVSIRDKEKNNLELKSIRIITEPSGKKDQAKQLAYGMVGLANKNGGRLILGVNDDGAFDGKFLGNTDDIKEYIHNICRDKISPIIEFEIHFIESASWDVFLIYIPKRRNIPHAYIMESIS